MKNKYNKNQTSPPGWLSFILALLFTGAGLMQNVQATVVQIGPSGAVNTAGNGADPVCDYYNSIKYQIIYTAAEIAAAGGVSGNITSLAWSVTQDPGSLAQYQVSMAHTATTTLTTTMLPPSSGLLTNYTVVKNSYTFNPVVGVNTITFDTPFNWDGTSNIFINICSGGSNPFGSPYGGVEAYAAGSNQAAFGRSDGTNVCGLNTGFNSSGVLANKPVVYFDMVVASCTSPGSLLAVPTGLNATLSWIAGGGATDYEVYWGASPLTAPDVLTTPTITTTGGGLSTAVTVGSPLTAYTFYVRTDCGLGTFSAWAGPFTWQSGCSGTACSWDFTIEDDFGDGWTGCAVELRQDGIVTNTFTLATGAGPVTIPANICDGSNVTLSFVAGSFVEETIFTCVDNNGLTRFSWAAGGNPGAGVFYTSNPATCAPPSCTQPSAPSGAQLTATTANISWTGGTSPYDLFISPTNTAPNAATTPTVNNVASSPYVLTISALVTRYIWVRSDCGGDNTTNISSWVGPLVYTQPPANDLCGDAIPIVCGNQLSGNNTGATTIGGPGAFCGTTPGVAGVWYSWTGNGDDVTLTTCNAPTSFDTKINVYSGSCGSLVCVAGNDDNCGAFTFRSTVGFTSTVGVNYFFYVTGYDAFEFGPFRLDMSCVTPTPPPANDECATPTVLTQLPFCVPTASTTVGATNSTLLADACGTGGDDDVWFEFQAATSFVNVQVQSGAGFDAVVAVYDACGGTQIGCSDGSATAGQETVSLSGLVVGNFYKVRVYSWNTGVGTQGNFTICVFNGVDPCSTISPITCGSIASYNETGAGVWTQAACGFGTPGKEKLFQFTTTTAGTYQLDVTSVTGTFGWVDYFFKEASLGCDQAAWNCIDDIVGAGFYQFGPLLASTTYYLLLDGEGTGAYNHTFRLICPPANDNCGIATAQLLGSASATCTPSSGTTQGANPSVVQTSLLPAADYPDVWYRFVALGSNAQITVSTSSLLAAGVEVYDGCGSATPICFEYAQAQGEDLSLTVTGLTSGLTYYIRVIDLLSGTLGLNFSTNFFTICVTPVPSPGPSCVTPPGGAVGEAANASPTPGEPCGSDVNGGCNMTPGSEYFEPYSIGQFVQGTVYAECGTRDTDWYEFTTGAQVSPVAFTVTSEFPVTAFILSGTCPPAVLAANSTSLDCDQVQATTVLQPNTTYHLAIVPNEFNGIPCTSTRNNYFMQLALVAPPANDDCVNAQAITCGVAGTCPSNQVTGNTLAALNDPNPAIVDPTCNVGGNISDIWYVFGSGVATEIEVNITLQSATSIGTELYTSCGVLVAASCVDNADALSPLVYAVTPGTTYRLRCYTNYDFENPGTFRLCVQHKPLPPVNDDICGAINLSLATTATGEVSGDNFYATNSPQTSMSCGTHSRDVWYKVTVPTSGVVTINTFFGTNQDLLAAIYSSSDNTCTGTLTQLACDDDRGPNNASWLQVNNRTPGDVLFVRVAGFGAFPASLNKGTFKVSATEGLLWTGASDAFFNTISDPDLGIPTNWYCYDGGAYGPGNLNNAAISVMIPINLPTQPTVSGVLNVNSVRAIGNFFNNGGITVQTGSQLNIHGGISSNGLAQPRFQGAGIFRFNSTGATTHNILNNARMFSTVTVAPTSTVASNGRLIFENNSSLFADSPAATYGSVTGNITYRRIGSASNYNYNYWSTPVNAATISSISAPGITPNTYQYDPANAFDASYEGLQAAWTAVGTGTTMTNARGYIATGAGASSFTGVPNQNNYTQSTVAGAGTAFNLVGNPYPAQLNAALFLSQNSGKITGGSIYVWDDDGTAGGQATYGNEDYIVSNGTVTVNGFNSGNPFSGSIASGQGFFINSNGAQTINFNRTARNLFGTNSEFFDVQDYARLKVRVVSANEVGAETALLFTPNATEGTDIDYDAVRLPGNADIAVYSFIEEGEYAIQGLPELSTEKIIPLGVINAIAGEAVISLSQFEYFETGVFVYLEDIQEGVFHNLNNGSYTYTNTSITSEDPIRFRLHLRAPLAVNATAACAGQASGKMILNNPNSVDVAVSVKNSENVTVASFGPFTGERVVENLLSGAYTVDFSYVNGDNASRQVDISAGSIVAPATFISSATNVPLEDAIIEFQGSAAGASSFEWNFGDGTIITNDLNPIHAYMTPGVYTVSLTARNGGCESVYTTEITVTALSTGVGSLANTTGFTIYPNPASSNANLMLNLDRKVSQVRIDIHDAAGKLVSSENVNDVRSGSIVELNIDGLANGIYQVTVEGKNFKDVGRLTISK